MTENALKKAEHLSVPLIWQISFKRTFYKIVGSIVWYLLHIKTFKVRITYVSIYLVLNFIVWLLQGISQESKINVVNCCVTRLYGTLSYSFDVAAKSNFLQKENIILSPKINLISGLFCITNLLQFQIPSITIEILCQSIWCLYGQKIGISYKNFIFRILMSSGKSPIEIFLFKTFGLPNGHVSCQIFLRTYFIFVFERMEYTEYISVDQQKNH